MLWLQHDSDALPAVLFTELFLIRISDWKYFFSRLYLHVSLCTTYFHLAMHMLSFINITTAVIFETSNVIHEGIDDILQWKMQILM